MRKPVLEVKNLSVAAGAAKLVENVSWELFPGEILGLVGESGSGKSLTAKAVLGLLHEAGSRMAVSGEVLLEGENVLRLGAKELRPLRGKKISIIFQDPLTALNPVLSIGKQVRELFLTHEKCSEREAAAKSILLLKKMGLVNAERVYRQYPHQLSGGMRQRVCIAIAIALKPPVIIADEPTTALDVTLQAQILAELKMLKNNYNAAILLISHDMGVIAEMADTVAVMQKGRIVEYSDCYSLFDYPQHDYTKKLLAASRLDELAEAR
ncbi:MAG: ABC transporter ATP-binding protein [Sporomusaceae bacterium]|nr:ABC transporter ATP-binding protein [Sporomusaceae bacterium]